METWTRPQICDANAEFKSYYVVWKPFSVCEIVKVMCRFKSYYVVWKLKFSFRHLNVLLRLNRTM